MDGSKLVTMGVNRSHRQPLAIHGDRRSEALRAIVIWQTPSKRPLAVVFRKDMDLPFAHGTYNQGVTVQGEGVAELTFRLGIGGMKALLLSPGPLLEMEQMNRP